MGRGVEAGIPGPWKEARRRDGVGAGAAGWARPRSGPRTAGFVRRGTGAAGTPLGARWSGLLMLQPERKILTKRWLTDRMNVLHVGRAVGFYWRPRDTQGKIRANNESKPSALQPGLAPCNCGARCVPAARGKCCPAARGCRRDLKASAIP